MIRSTATPSPYRTSYGARYDPAQNYGIAPDSQPPDFIGGMPSPIASPDSATTPLTPAAQKYVAGMPQINPANQPQTEQSGNAVQRWKNGYTHRYTVDMGLVDAAAPQSPLDTTPSGASATAGINGDFTPNAQWNQGFDRQIQIPKASAPTGGFSWDAWYPTAGGNPNAPQVNPNPIPATSKPDFNS